MSASKSSSSTKQLDNNSSHKKNKLRTASDVISRLRWSSSSSTDDDEEDDDIMIGYEDRINGPMEKSIIDYRTIDEGGDIPQHRIQYFRRRTARQNEDTTTSTTTTTIQLRESILWDRLGRVDKIFGSGGGSNSMMISDETITMASNAIVNMKRLEEEQELKRQIKAQRKARARQHQIRRRRQQHLQNATTTSAAATSANSQQQNRNNQALIAAATTTTPSSISRYHDRYEWKDVPWYEFSDSEWREGELSPPTSQRRQQQPRRKILKVVTWNVLFDLFETKEDESNENSAEFVVAVEEEEVEKEGGIHRWQSLIREISQTNADIICLQEVTPNFVKLLCSSSSSKKLRQTYAMSAAAAAAAAEATSTADGSARDNLMLDTIVPFGNLILWNRHTLDCQSLHVLHDGIYRKRCVIATLQDKCVAGNVYMCANVHLPADGVFDGEDKVGSIGSNTHDEERIASRAIARKRELGLIVGKLQLLQEEELYYYDYYNKTKKNHTATSGNCVPIPLIVGDFNIDDENNAHELNDGCFAAGYSTRHRTRSSRSGSSSSDIFTTTEDGFFVDVWQRLRDNNKEEDGSPTSSSSGATFDPTTNVRAKKNSRRRSSNKTKKGQPRRIDRIYVGGTRRKSGMMIKGLVPLLEPTTGTLLGTTTKDHHLPLPPSDHYGVQVTLDIPDNTVVSSTQTSLLLRHDEPTRAGHTINTNAWSASAVPCSNTLLALVLKTVEEDDGEDEDDKNYIQKMYDHPQSTLPIPHITLLNGFVELNCKESRILAKQAVHDAIQQVLRSMDNRNGNNNTQNHDTLVVPFHKENSLSIFEHSSSSLSCSLVNVPDMECDQGRWLKLLYTTLRSSFRLCDTQESRFENGWTPHGTFFAPKLT